MFLVFCVSVLFLGCTKESPMAPGSNSINQVADTFEKGNVKTYFEGISSPFSVISFGDTTYLPNDKMKITGYISEFIDVADDWRVSGTSIWYVTFMVNANGSGKMFGKADLFVGDDSDNPLGKWEMTHHEVLTPTDVGFDIAGTVNGTGKEGVVKGMVAKWNYTMHFNFSDPTTFFYSFDGYLISKE